MADEKSKNLTGADGPDKDPAQPEAGGSPVCPVLYMPLFLNDSVPEEHKAGIDMRRDLLRRSHVLLVCGGDVDEDVKNDIAVAGRLGIAATTLDGILAVKGLGKDGGGH